MYRAGLGYHGHLSKAADQIVSKRDYLNFLIKCESLCEFVCIWMCVGGGIKASCLLSSIWTLFISIFIDSYFNRQTYLTNHPSISMKVKLASSDK